MENIKRKGGFILVMTLLIPLFIIKIPWYILVLICWFDEKIGDLYQDMEDEVFEDK